MVAILSWNLGGDRPMFAIRFFPRGSDSLEMLRYVLAQKDMHRKVVVYEIKSLDEQPDEIAS